MADHDHLHRRKAAPAPLTPAPAAPQQEAERDASPPTEPLGGLRYHRSPIQRQDLAPAAPDAEARNGITAGENRAVQALSGGRVDLHAEGARLVQAPADDARLQAAGARSMAQGKTAIVSNARDRGHELWHLAQQAMSQVKAVTTVSGQPLNDEPRLEHEADRMGSVINQAAGDLPAASGTAAAPPAQGVIQGVRVLRDAHRKRPLSGSAKRNKASKVIRPKRMRGLPDVQELKLRPPGSRIDVRRALYGVRGPGQQKYLTRLRSRMEKRERSLLALIAASEQDDSESAPSTQMEVIDTPAPVIPQPMTEQEQLQMLAEDAVVDLLQESGGTAQGDWGDILPRLHGDVRKSVAAMAFKYWLANAGDEVDGDLVMRKLEALGRLFNLDFAGLVPTGEVPSPFGPAPTFSAAFAASPAVYVPLVSKAVRSPYLATHKASTDTLKPVKFDADKPTPAHELITQFNKHFAGKAYDKGNPAKTIDKLNTSHSSNETLLKSNPNKTYDRPGSVEATITTPKPTAGRTGSGETEVGWFGGDEERIIEGTDTIKYEGGHLIGDQLMDGDNTFDMYKNWNLAPQAKSFNNPLYITSMENAAVKALKGGATLDYQVNVAYPADTYKIKALDVVTHAVDGAKKMKSTGDTFVDAVKDYVKANPTANTDFTFLARVPNYWKAEMSDTAKKGVISGSGRNDPRGPFTTTPVVGSTAYKPSGVEQFTFSLAADGTQLALPTKGPKSKKNLASYSGANSVSLSARQKSFVDAPAATAPVVPVLPIAPVLPVVTAPVVTAPVAPKIGSMSAADINKIVKYTSRSQAIYTYLQSNVIATLDDLIHVPGVSNATIKLLKMAGVAV